MRLSILIALTPLLFAAAPSKPPMVTVTKSDGTSVRGQLSTIDPKGVAVQTIVKGAPAGDTLQIPWSDVKSLSNGMTRERVINQWKREHPDDACPECAGEGKVACETCKGTGRDRASAKDCPTCKGEQTVACKTPKCDHGKIPCPKMHLKLTEGTWFERDGKKWRRFNYPNGRGYQEASEHHVGEIIESVDGIPQPPKACPRCAGKMVLDDPKCRGTGLQACQTCTNAARTAPCKECDRGRVACKPCTGLGLKPEVTGLPTGAPAAQ